VTPASERPTQTIDLADGGRLSLFERWLAPDEERSLHEALVGKIPWRQEHITLFGKPVAQPRLTAAFADTNVIYRYSGLVVEPHPWTPEIIYIKIRAERDAGHAFNYVLANLYREGGDSMGFHADDEPELGENPVIASLSLGATRRFVLKHRRRSLPPVPLDLTGGSLLVMAGTTQHYWHHGVPKTRRAVGPRLNLTFRWIVG
jgi:alkylated DNA repair dioxygenase AlkB